MTTITITAQNEQDTELLVSLAKRLRAKVVSIKKNEGGFAKNGHHRSLSDAFDEACKKYSTIVADPLAAAVYFQKTLENLSENTLPHLVFSLTDSDSIYFRFPLKNPGDRVHLEVFYTKENKADDVEAVVNIYQNDKIIVKNYGSLEKVFEIINQYPS